MEVPEKFLNREVIIYLRNGRKIKGKITFIFPTFIEIDGVNAIGKQMITSIFLVNKENEKEVEDNEQ